MGGEHQEKRTLLSLGLWQRDGVVLFPGATPSPERQDNARGTKQKTKGKLKNTCRRFDSCILHFASFTPQNLTRKKRYFRPK
jgi:hypothetical protein